MWVDMIYNGFAQTLIFLITCKFAESYMYSLRLNDGPVSCINITDGHWIISAIHCGLHASRNELYHHGFVYTDGHCYLCRSNNAHCGIPTEEVLMSGPYHIEGESDAHYSDVIMTTIASQITSLTIVYSIVYSDADQRKHQSCASLAFVRRIHRWPVNSPHKRPVTRKCLHLMTSSWTDQLYHHVPSVFPRDPYMYRLPGSI